MQFMLTRFLSTWFTAMTVTIYLKDYPARSFNHLALVVLYQHLHVEYFKFDKNLKILIYFNNTLLSRKRKKGTAQTCDWVVSHYTTVPNNVIKIFLTAGVYRVLPNHQKQLSIIKVQNRWDRYNVLTELTQHFEKILYIFSCC